MNSTGSFSNFTARLREFIAISARESFDAATRLPSRPTAALPTFGRLALELFGLQFAHNPPYRKFCEARGASPTTIREWERIPPLPAAAFKEWELSCLPSGQRSKVFHSSGTTAQRLSRHFHNDESLALYEDSLWPWFAAHVLARSPSSAGGAMGRLNGNWRPVILTPPPAQAPHSSLVHMFETVRRKLGCGLYFGRTARDGSWKLDVEAIASALREASDGEQPVILLSTAFCLLHLLDWLTARDLRLRLPAGSRALETGGYKGRSRTLPRAELHALMTRRLGIPPPDIICEYGMSELSSQAYDRVAEPERAHGRGPMRQGGPRPPATIARPFRFPPWAQARIVSPETGAEVGEGETGLLRVFDLANVYSVIAIQTEDLGVRRGEGFELIGRGEGAEPRGCSLMTA